MIDFPLSSHTPAISLSVRTMAKKSPCKSPMAINRLSAELQSRDRGRRRPKLDDAFTG